MNEGNLVASVEYDSGFTELLLSAPAAVAHLESLHLNIRTPQGLLLALSPTLRHLRINDGISSHPLSPQLTSHMYFVVVNVLDDDPLDLPPPSPHLRTLELGIAFREVGPLPMHLVSVFAKIAEDYPCLELVVLHCWSYTRGASSISRAHPAFHAGLPPPARGHGRAAPSARAATQPALCAVGGDDARIEGAHQVFSFWGS
jgi:hypothetical protein